ncbi:cell envelope integrity protein TolA [Ramlibacter terrae]|uniref:Cell envelope integrity protein TolA n=1 Tax=Ramlibacter terrae TaxID=2732511 RepID=A0ABX6P285_9BURK|nr:cell envelope integrity protein TolA [Ramlibacter terrae]
MQVTADDRSAFAPPQQPGLVRAFALAVVAHLLLVAALTTGLQWKRDSTELSAEAELWSAVPQQAAPKEVVAPPPPPAPPVVRAPPAPDPQVQRDAQIALEREREKEKREKAEREEAQREAAERRRAERERKAEADRKLAAAAERKREEEAEKREQVKLAAEARRKEEAQKKKREEQDAQRVAKQREENLKRIQGMAGGTGSPSSTGSAAVSSGPSASWAGRVRGRVRPNIVFSDDVAGNPTAEVEVRMAPDGTIVGKRLVKPSGNRGWDEAVLRALDKTETLPRDTDGRVHSPVVITFRPKD